MQSINNSNLQILRIIFFNNAYIKYSDFERKFEYPNKKSLHKIKFCKSTADTNI